MTAEDLMLRLKEGGEIVSSNDCTSIEIVQAQAYGRFWVDERAFGYLYRPAPAKGVPIVNLSSSLFDECDRAIDNYSYSDPNATDTDLRARRAEAWALLIEYAQEAQGKEAGA